MLVNFDLADCSVLGAVQFQYSSFARSSDCKNSTKEVSIRFSLNKIVFVNPESYSVLRETDRRLPPKLNSCLASSEFCSERLFLACKRQILSNRSSCL